MLGRPLFVAQPARFAAGQKMVSDFPVLFCDAGSTPALGKWDPAHRLEHRFGKEPLPRTTCRPPEALPRIVLRHQPRGRRRQPVRFRKRRETDPGMGAPV